MHRRTALHLAACLALAAALFACSPPPTPPPTPPDPPPPGALVPYSTRTATPTPSGKPPTPTLIPSATPTPVTYTVKKDDDLFGIALRYGVSLPALKTANPTVLPNFLSVGIVLVIPVTPPPPGTPPAPQATATPAAVRIDPPRCYPAADGGAWCLTVARNSGERGVENVTVLFRRSGETSPQSEQTAITPLNILPARGALPVAAFFPAPVPPETGAEAHLEAFLPVPDGDRRYLPVEILNQQTSLGSRAARVSGEIRLAADSGLANAVWVLAVAYDSEGEVIGLRKWENPSPLEAGETLPFELSVYSLGPDIERVETFVEAQP